MASTNRELGGSPDIATVRELGRALMPPPSLRHGCRRPRAGEEPRRRHCHLHRHTAGFGSGDPRSGN
ncbi:hypothetical protein E2562_037953 [Oryza meyeriana var. granulata]|uniref:Uncharacterized protein n=1 Tax=Oryza meyeriana var. granulata TaxID=110450 RepID=A0A6G1EU49_9ORYZ|nr:hypothetical protein E2562_037953 [Oryza meyeriana var. granulata]